MKALRRVLRGCGLLLMLGFAWACGFDDTLREYLSARFWLPFARQAANFEKPGVRRISAAFAGMTAVADGSPLAKLRDLYQHIPGANLDEARRAVAALRTDPSLTPRQKEEVELIDAKLDLREADRDDRELLETAKTKLEAFLRTAGNPDFLSEARGWLGRVHFLLGEQSAAGKIYLDELNRDGSNLSRETLLHSLRLTYGYDGGPELLEHLEDYFDTPEHAVFAIQLLTNPRWERGGRRAQPPETSAAPYRRIQELLDRHRDLLGDGGGTLALLTMRTALRMGDPAAATKIAAAIPANAAVRKDPDFNWMSGSARFLSHQYAAAERPLLTLFRSPLSSESQRAAAAYGLCGVYSKTGNPVEQLRFALWLHAELRKSEAGVPFPSGIQDLSIYWAVSGWDLNLLLDAQAPVEALRTFIARYPDVPDIRLVRYSLAVRLTRENRYEEAAGIYREIGAGRRAPRITELASLYQEANRTGASGEAKYKLAEFIASNPDRIYFNDALWGGLQRYAFQASTDSRLTGAERRALLRAERKLKDDQEERWRAYQILSEVVRDADDEELKHKAAALAVRCLRGMSNRFEREEEIRKADIEMSRLAGK